MLMNRFNNRRVLVNNQLEALTSHPHQKAETIIGIRSMLDETIKSLKSLHNLEVPVDNPL